MASNERSTKLSGSIITTPTGGNLPTEVLSVLAETGNYTTYATGSFTRAAAGADTTIDFSVYGITDASPAKFFYLKARDIVTGAAKSVLLTITQSVTAAAGMTPSATFAQIGTDFFYLTTENARMQQVVVKVQNAGNSTEVNWAVGG